MQYLSIKNFAKYQHYKDRNPPWIKLYYSVLDDYAFLNLPESAQLLYLKLLLIASRSDNHMPLSLDYLQKVCRGRVTEPMVLGLIESELLSVRDINRESVSVSPLSLSLSLSLSKPLDITPLASIQQDASTTLALPNGKSLNTKAGRGKRAIAETDGPTERHRHFAQTLHVDVGPEWGKFKNYCLAHDKRYANFEAAFRNWLANADQMKGRHA